MNFLDNQKLKSALKEIQELDGLRGRKDDQEKSAAVQVLEDLIDGTLSFGNPEHTLKKLDHNTFTDLGTDERWKYYLVQVPVAVNISKRIKVEEFQLKVQLDSEQSVSTLKLFPTTRWKSLVEAGTKVDLGLDAKANFTVSATQVADLGIPVDASLVSQNTGNVFLKIGNLGFQVKHYDIKTGGNGHSFAQWIFREPNTVESELQAGLILQMGATSKKLSLDCLAYLKPQQQWFMNLFNRYFEWLSPKSKDMVNSISDSPVGKRETYHFSL